MKERYLIAIAVSLILLYLSPLVVLGEDSHVRIHDNLDSNVVWYKILAESGKEFAPSNAEIPNMMNGLPRISLGSQFKLYVLLFNWFDPFTAYTINMVLIRFIAFIGMYLLLKKHLIKGRYSLITVGVALAFSLLPFWPFGALSIAGLPLALYTFLNFRNRNASLKDWLIVTLLPFYSSLILTFVFFLALMSVLWIYDIVRTKHPNWQMFLAMAVMSAVFLGKLYRLVEGVLFGYGFTPHRAEFSLGHNSLSSTMRLFVENFTTAHTHSYTMQSPVIMYVAAAALLIVLISKLKQHFSDNQSLPEQDTGKSLIFFVALVAVFSLWYAFWYWEGMRVIKNMSGFLNTFNFGRIHFLNAVIWYLIFALALTIVSNRIKFGNLIVGILLIGQLFILFDHHHELKYRRIDFPSYEQFYSEELFGNIKKYIAKDPADYRVVSIGIHPAIAQYNGFYTIDLYTTMYPLDYKHRFRGIIEEELEKSETLEHYFDTWGGRLYVYTSELGKNYMYTKAENEILNNLKLGTKKIKNMGGDYILSAVKIANAKENNLELLNVFENNNSVWRVHLYKVM